MKICIIGTHSTGKTTLVEALSRALIEKGIETRIVSEISRLCPFPINEQTTLDAQGWILDHQIEYESLYSQLPAWVLCDRASIDNFAYLERAAVNIDISHYLEKSVRHMDTYDFVFKTKKLHKDAVHDGVRSTDELFRADIDERIARLLDTHSISHQELPESFDPAVHVEFILGEVAQHSGLL